MNVIEKCDIQTVWNAALQKLGKTSGFRGSNRDADEMQTTVPPVLPKTTQTQKAQPWLHLEFVDWRSASSHHEEHDRRILLKERPAPYHHGRLFERQPGFKRKTREEFEEELTRKVRNTPGNNRGE